MLIWLNGPFGGGKTQTAHELARRLPGSVICDPEEVGYGLHRALPRELRADFQDLRSWRDGTCEVLDVILSSRPGPVIAPMTLVEADYFDQIVGRLRDRGHDVRHFALLAERETVLRRLRERGFGRVVQALAGQATALHRESFAVANLDRCLTRLREPEFAEHIWTDDLSVERVAERIGSSAGLDLRPNTDGALHGRLRRAAVGVRHIRVR